MASDADDGGRLRGLDIDDDDDNPGDLDTSGGSNGDEKLLETSVPALQRTIREQASTIEKLRMQLMTVTEDVKQNKKRKRDGTDKDTPEPSTKADTSDISVNLRKLRDENKTLKEKLTTMAEKLTSYEKQAESTENRSFNDKTKGALAKRILPSNPPLPNISTLLQEMQSALTKNMTVEMKKMESSLELSINDKITKTCHELQTKSYAASVTGNTNDSDKQEKVTAPKVANLRTIMMNQKNEEILEENDRKTRAKNFVVHGKKEEGEGDDAFIKELLIQVCSDDSKIVTVKRIGTAAATTTQPILVQMQSEADKIKVMSNLRNLKDVTKYAGLSITDDYTLAEREMIRNYRQKAKVLNEQNPDAETVVRVRGCPKNGLFLKKLKKTTLLSQSTATEQTM